MWLDSFKDFPGSFLEITVEFGANYRQNGKGKKSLIETKLNIHLLLIYYWKLFHIVAYLADTDYKTF